MCLSKICPSETVSISASMSAAKFLPSSCSLAYDPGVLSVKFDATAVGVVVLAGVPGVMLVTFDDAAVAFRFAILADCLVVVSVTFEVTAGNDVIPSDVPGGVFGKVWAAAVVLADTDAVISFSIT